MTKTSAIYGNAIQNGLLQNQKAHKFGPWYIALEI